MTLRNPLPTEHEKEAIRKTIDAYASRLPNISRLTAFDLQSLQILADGCALHPEYRVTHHLDVPARPCAGCMDVYKARAGLTVAGLLQWKETR